MSMIPTRLLVIQRLCELLEEVEVETEAEMISLKNYVFRGRNILGETEKAPCIAVLESPRPDFAVYAAEENVWRKDNLTLLIQGRAVDDKAFPSDPAYYMCAAVEQRLSRIVAVKSGGRPQFPEHYMLGNLITSMEVAPPVVRPPEDKASASAFFFLVLRVGIAVNIAEPYTSVP